MNCVTSTLFTLWLFNVLQISYLEMKMEATKAEKDKLVEYFRRFITNLQVSMDAQLVMIFVLISISNGVNRIKSI